MALVLMLLIGGYGMARAQTQTEMENAAEREMATNDFLGLKWGMGIGVIGGFGGEGAVEKASIGADKIVRIDEEGDLRPQMFLEMHVFPWERPFAGGKVKEWREYQESEAKDQPPAPLMGFGPFVAAQSSDDTVIDALALGFMWGFRRNPKESSSVNIGVGVSFDPSVQVLGEGMEEGEETDETAVRFKKKAQFGWALMVSFTF